MPDRILIFGNAGASKSTLAKSIASELDLAHLDLDTLDAADIERFADTHEGWVVEGANSQLLAPLLNECSELLFLNSGASDLPLSDYRWMFRNFAGVKREMAAG